MTSRERVIAVIEHRKPDRMPIYGWVRGNLEAQITQAFGSVEAFEDKYEFDFAHLFGGPGPYPGDALTELRTGGELTPDRLLDVTLNDPNNIGDYQGMVDGIRHHKESRGRFVYMQTPGIFECLNGCFGIENHLAYLLLFEDELQEVYRRQAEWNKAFAMNCIDLGIDMVHVSDDWGQQHDLMFSPATWWKMIYPHHKVTTRAVKARGTFVSLHCDGCFNSVIDGVLDLGYDVVHPWQESANMSLREFKEKYIGRISVMGGLDVQTTIGFGRLDFLKSEIERVIGMFADGGLLFCTTHFVQNHCTIEELTYAYDLVYELVRT